MRALAILVAFSGLAGCVLDRSGTRLDDAGPARDGGLADAAGLDAARADAGTLDAGCLAPRRECPGAGCVDPTADAEHCGGCGERCSAPPNATATCQAGACGHACAPGFEPAGPACVPARCGNGALDDGEGCDDSNVDDGDGCNSSCMMESDATDACPGAALRLTGAVASFVETTLGRSSRTSCPPGGTGPDALFAIEPRFSGDLRVRVQPFGEWDVTVEVRPRCPSEEEPLSCTDRYFAGGAEQVDVPVDEGRGFDVIVSGFRIDDAGDFTITFQAI